MRNRRPKGRRKVAKDAAVRGRTTADRHAAIDAARATIGRHRPTAVARREMTIARRRPMTDGHPATTTSETDKETIMRHTLTIWLLLTSAALAYERLRGPTEMLYWDKEKAYNGYTLFGRRGRTFLIDMEGRVVHHWRIGTNPHLLDNGHILDATRDDPSGFPGFQEVDWDSKVVWEYREQREGYAPHHDWVRHLQQEAQCPHDDLHRQQVADA